MKKLFLTLIVSCAAVFAQDVEYIAGNQDDVVQPSGGDDASYGDYDNMSWSNTVTAGMSGGNGGSSSGNGGSGSSGSAGGAAGGSAGGAHYGISAAIGYGVFYGYDVPMYSELYDKYGGVGGAIGVDLLYPLSGAMEFRTGGELEFHSGSSKFTTTQCRSYYGCVSIDAKVSAWIVYLDVPAALRYNLGSLYVEAGATLGLRLASGGKVFMSAAGYDYEQKQDKAFSGLSFMFNPAVGYKIDYNKDVEIIGGIGLTKLDDVSGSNDGDSEYNSKAPKMMQAQIRFNYWL